jgi:hypothetical protein
MSTAKNPSENSKPVRVAINLIKADKALQPRVEMDNEHMLQIRQSFLDVFRKLGVEWMTIEDFAASLSA